MTRHPFPWCLALATALGLASRRADAQGPTYPPPPAPAPGSTQSTMGPIPGAGGIPFRNPPGAGEDVLGGRTGTAFPRVPASITTPSGGTITPPGRGGIAPPRALLVAPSPAYSRLELPAGPEDEGPPDGLTLDAAIELMLQRNLELRSRFYEIPQAQADVLTASLRANPILYADSQLIPYGQYSRERPGGPLQYDLNITHPLDLNNKRRARTAVAVQARKVLEAQYQDAVRLWINNLYTAYLDVIAARESARYARVSVKGFDEVLSVTRELYRLSKATRADVERVEVQRDIAEVGLADEQERLRRSKRALAALLFLPPAAAESIELRGSLADSAPPPPPAPDLIRNALEARPDLMSYRLGILRAEADVRLARANRLSDVYMLYQPYTFQNNAPFGAKSATSWAVGMTVPLPVYNRNQGVIERARLNVTQTQIELAALQRQVMAEVEQAEREYAVTRAAVERFKGGLLKKAERMLEDSRRLFEAGETPDVVTYLNARRDYNDVVRQYVDLLVRHRRSMLGLNTAVGQRILP
jgi:outer membrane protein, heavy metal efflux system